MNTFLSPLGVVRWLDPPAGPSREDVIVGPLAWPPGPGGQTGGGCLDAADAHEWTAELHFTRMGRGWRLVGLSVSPPLVVEDPPRLTAGHLREPLEPLVRHSREMIARAVYRREHGGFEGALVPVDLSATDGSSPAARRSRSRGGRPPVSTETLQRVVDEHTQLVAAGLSTTQAVAQLAVGHVTTERTVWRHLKAAAAAGISVRRGRRRRPTFPSLDEERWIRLRREQGIAGLPRVLADRDAEDAELRRIRALPSDHPERRQLEENLREVPEQ